MCVGAEGGALRREVMVHVVRHYGESLRYGCQHVYHSMPRLLSIWFDLGSQVAEMGRARRSTAAREKLEQYLAHMTDKVEMPLWLGLDSGC